MVDVTGWWYVFCDVGVDNFRACIGIVSLQVLEKTDVMCNNQVIDDLQRID
jgi:hypothetical protein